MRYTPCRELYRNVHLYFDTVMKQKVIVKKFKDRSKLIHEYNNNIFIHKINKKNKAPVALQVVYDVDILQKKLIMNYMKGYDLLDYIGIKMKRNESIYHNSIMKDVGKSIQWLKENNLVHLDIKLENFIYDEDTDRLSLIDFHSLESLASFTWMKSFHMVGTNSFMSPEMFHEQSFHRNTDLWSMGIMGFIISEKYNPLNMITVNRSSVQEFAYQELKRKDNLFAEKIFHLLHFDPDNRTNHF